MLKIFWSRFMVAHYDIMRVLVSGPGPGSRAADRKLSRKQSFLITDADTADLPRFVLLFTHPSYCTNLDNGVSIEKVNVLLKRNEKGEALD